ncbi:hypothetical protein C2S52_013331 [Perilla frutescens var. hirtella]|nr:hypothetical protein C2S51_015632 [Perilla frutescens var. frutescens]KAH6775770.1 hypothetical protein C2S52_013331 [Perilla frutescens var. hirtella]
MDREMKEKGRRESDLEGEDGCTNKTAAEKARDDGDGDTSRRTALGLAGINFPIDQESSPLQFDGDDDPFGSNEFLLAVKKHENVGI